MLIPLKLSLDLAFMIIVTDSGLPESVTPKNQNPRKVGL